MSVLCWDKPEKVMSTEEWKRISADGAPPGVYTPNMSEADMQRWRAKFIGGKDPRVEIRKLVIGCQRPVPPSRFRAGWYETEGNCAQLLCIVDGHSVRISANGTLDFENPGFADLVLAVQEARSVLESRGKP